MKRATKPKYLWPRDAWTRDCHNWADLRSYGFPDVEDPLKYTASLQYLHRKSRWRWGIHKIDGIEFIAEGFANTRAEAKAAVLKLLNSGALASAERRRALRDVKW